MKGPILALGERVPGNIILLEGDYFQKQKESSSTSFRSRDLRVTNNMGPARYTSCAMLLQECDKSLYNYSCHCAVRSWCLVIDHSPD